MYLAYILKPVSLDVLHAALLFLRVSVGLIMTVHGLGKLRAGTETWRSVGSAMSYFGINFLHLFWGLLAALTEFFGGIALALGLLTRVASFLLTIVMVVACRMHIKMGDQFRVYSCALTLLAVFITFVVIGGGALSLDHFLKA